MWPQDSQPEEIPASKRLPASERRVGTPVTSPEPESHGLLATPLFTAPIF